MFLHGGTWSRAAPHNALFEANDRAEKFLKGPPSGISPRSWLKDKFRYFRFKSVSRDFGIASDKLFLAKFKCARPFNLPNELGIGPSKLLFAKERFNKS